MSVNSPPPCNDDPWEKDLVISRASSTPAYLQLTQLLERFVMEGRIAPGAALPSERTLAERLGLSRMTVRRALEGLVEAGLVERRQGSGTFVRRQALEQHVEGLASFKQEVALMGSVAGATLLNIEQFRAGEVVARSLELEPGTTILRVLRLRTVNGEPFEVQDAYLPPRFLPLSIVQLTQTGSLYESLDTQFGARPLRAVQSVGARMATTSEAKYLKLTRDVPVVSKQRITYGMDERPMEFVRCAARSDQYRLLFELSDR